MEYSSEQQRLIDKVFSLFSDNLMCLDTWGYYLQNEPKDSELRNKLGILWLASLFDSVKAESSYIPGYKSQANKLELHYLQRYLDQALEFISVIKDVLTTFSKEEQVFITHLRNQMIHSFLHGRHDNSFKIKYVENGELKIENVGCEQYGELTRELFRRGNLVKNASILLENALNFNLRYWKIMRELQAKRAAIHEAMKKGETFDWDNISA